MAHADDPAPAGGRWLRTLLPVYTAAALRLAMPLMVLPLMAVRLGPQAFGHLGFILVWSGLLALVVEGGFLASATRLAVGADTAQRWRLAQQVASARWLLCVVAVLLAIGVAQWVPPAADDHRWGDAAAIAVLACALGWSANWYLQATQQLGRWAGVEGAVYAVLIAACWTAATDVTRYVMLQCVASGVLALAGWHWVRRDVGGVAGGVGHAAARLWSARQVAPGLRLGWTMLPVSLAGAAYSFALPAAASLQMPKAELGLYFMADRIVRALLAGAEPLFAVVYPRIVGLFAADRRAALRYAARWAVAGVVGGMLLLWLADLCWPTAQHLLADRAARAENAPNAAVEPQRLHDVLAVLGWLLPLLLGWKFLGYWMLGSGRHDRAYRASMYTGAVVGVTAAALWPGAASAVGLAWVALAAEAAVIGVAVAGVVLTRPRHAPQR